MNLGVPRTTPETAPRFLHARHHNTRDCAKISDGICQLRIAFRVVAVVIGSCQKSSEGSGTLRTKSCQTMKQTTLYVLIAAFFSGTCGLSLRRLLREYTYQGARLWTKQLRACCAHFPESSFDQSSSWWISSNRLTWPGKWANLINLFMSRHEVHSMNTHTLQNAGW